ncbi:hypothetical protein B0H17DRAFT_1191367 [Mycena rosella]|uniref:Ubiquitin-like protease family profile domain-containing protein n=1 Tax=Mycena rosella TaxID=1033263 RepID=A0AAD7MB79_MYCRO|nr:hypothetical protein B0H17DRAFT_1191367 [Mycena rosella]
MQALATFPPDLSVTDLLAVKLPGITEKLSNNFRKTKGWFSTDLPNCDPLTSLWSLKSTPSISLLRELEHDFPQEWLNGAKSVLHPFNNSLRLPLFALGFFRKIHDLREGQEKWSESVEWARDEVPEADLGIFDTISWNTVHSGALDGQLDWTRLVADEWLSGGIIDEMMVDIQSRVAAIPLHAEITVAPLAFQRAIIALSINKNPSKYTLRLLDGYKKLVEAGKPRLYFPLHINNNHWIAFVIDFARKVFGYGDSLGRKKSGSAFTPHLRKWLDAAFPDVKFQNLGGALLSHANQKDYVHCGIYTGKVIQMRKRLTG